MSSSRNIADRTYHQTRSSFVRNWAKDDRVLCRNLTLNPEIYYEAKILKVIESQFGPIYTVHYQGWNSRHDERISFKDALLRFKEYTKADAEKAKEELEALRKRKSSLKTEGLSAKRKASFQTSEMAKENYDKMGSIQIRQLRSESLPNKTKATKLVRLSAPPPLKQSTRVNPNATKMINGADTGASRGAAVHIFGALRRILVEDEKMITERKALPKLPARITVFDIFQQYRKEIGPNNSFADHPSESALGLLDYFETMIGRMLLYKFEQPMFDKLKAKLEEDADDENENAENIAAETHDGVKILYSKQFGFPHLLRMFVHFSRMLSYGEWTKQTYDAVILRAQHFITFLDKNHSKLCNFETDYFAAPPEYLERIRMNEDERLIRLMNEV